MKKTLVSTLIILGGCATAPPQELVDARAAYQRALHGPAAQYAPADLHKAQSALQVAEQSFADYPKDQKTRDLAYVAERKSEISEAIAHQEIDNGKKAQADQDFVGTQGKQLSQTREQLQGESARLERERLARMSAEERAADAQAKVAEAETKTKELEDNLAKLAAVKEEERGLVITLSGSVLFASNKAQLLPDAQTRLNQVAEALLNSKERDITVEGYTDSRGSDDYNRDLSQRRAESVRSYLVSRGVPTDKIRAEGLGKDRPIADNTSAEGRANNRRVEIVVAPKKESE